MDHAPADAPAPATDHSRLEGERPRPGLRCQLCRRQEAIAGDNFCPTCRSQLVGGFVTKLAPPRATVAFGAEAPEASQAEAEAAAQTAAAADAAATDAQGQDGPNTARSSARTDAPAEAAPARPPRRMHSRHRRR